MSTLEATCLYDGDKESLRNNFQAAVRARDRARAELATAEEEADEAGHRAVPTARSARDLVSGIKSRLNVHMRDEINSILEELVQLTASANNVSAGGKHGCGEY